MYPPHLVAPMKAQLTDAGFTELLTAADVDNFMENQKGTAVIVINSVCGCAAGTCRPGVLASLANATIKPDQLVTVFAGVDTEATQRMREHIPMPPSSPSIALYKNGELAHFVERHHIEGRSAEMIAQHLGMVYDELCATEA
ncbi:BrxA/BrxB family bacilliredoxin [Arcticibacterium luteifluviistationis]|uniref:BrxA/BrxB family bacilliredoxin n=1 Tax=Arcticibacterium luteifluviistationis TaxID=1784714 RepID=A0A2Z4G6Q1_9BACT|nr:BrxA/BrxB family bacilliredoxin [Arcticibacterium luteifluviistationis]AWV96836.1 BrxA/BrxB family bacilliredoxin [Arcticibacterium luteifluviistationis]